MDNPNDPQVQDEQQVNQSSGADVQQPLEKQPVVAGLLASLGGSAFHNFKGTPLEVWKQISRATGPDVLKMDAAEVQVIDVSNFYVHHVNIEGDTPGEFSDAVRVVLIANDGKMIGFASAGIASDLSKLIDAFGMGPYDPPISVQIKPFRTRKGRVAYSIQPQ